MQKYKKQYFFSIFTKFASGYYLMFINKQASVEVWKKPGEFKKVIKIFKNFTQSEILR